MTIISIYMNPFAPNVISTNVEILSTKVHSVPVSNTDTTYSYMEFLIHGSMYLKCSSIYQLVVRITFVSSWSTMMSGPITLASDFARRRSTATSIIPYDGTPATWVVHKLIMFPLYVIGVYSDTFERDVVIDSRFSCDHDMPDETRSYIPSQLYPIEPLMYIDVSNVPRYIVRVRVIPIYDGSFPYVLSVSARFNPIETGYFKAYIYIILYSSYLCIYASFSVYMMINILIQCFRYMFSIHEVPLF
jgi:hypothetical protein